MPSQTWNNKVNSNSDSTLTLAYDRVDNNGTHAWLVNPRFTLWMKSASWTDSNNWIDVGGTAIVDKRVHPVTGESAQPINNTRTWTNFSAESVPLSYGGTADASFSVTIYGISWFNGDSSTDTYTLSVPMPGRAYSKPNPPLNFAGSRVTDGRMDLTWQGNYTGMDGAKPWTGLRLDRWDNVSNTWTRIANLGWSATSYSDTTTVANRRYHYQLWAYNSAGDSTKVQVSDLYTTPAGASQPSWTKTGAGDVTLAWTVNAPQASKQWVEDSTDGGTTWTKVSGDLSGTATTWTHTAPLATVTHRYRIVTQTPNLLTGTSASSTVVQLLTPPNAPTNIGPAVSALEDAFVVTWQHQSVDGSPQSAYQLRHRVKGGGTWTTVGKTTSTTSAHTLTGYTTPGEVEVEVSTWGAHADPSPWSATHTARRSARPVAGLTTPDGSGTWSSSTLPVEATYFDAEGTPLSAWRIRLIRDGVVIVDRTGGPGNPYSTTFTGLDDGVTYTVATEARDGHGLWSTTDTQTLTVGYLPPPAPVVEVTFLRERAEAIIQVTNPAPTGGEPDAMRNEVFDHTGQLLGEVSPDGALVWRVPPLDGTAKVTVRAWSDLPSSVLTNPVPVPLPQWGDLGIHLNAGPGYGRHAALWGGSPQVGWKPDVDVTVDTWVGDVLPSATYGPTEPLELSLAGRVKYTEPESSRAHWLAVLRAKTTVCYRDAVRTLYGAVTGPGFTERNTRFGDVSLTFTETLSDARDLFDYNPVLIEDPVGSGQYRIVSVETGTPLIWEDLG